MAQPEMRALLVVGDIPREINLPGHAEFHGELFQPRGVGFFPAAHYDETRGRLRLYQHGHRFHDLLDPFRRHDSAEVGEVERRVLLHSVFTRDERQDERLADDEDIALQPELTETGAGRVRHRDNRVYLAVRTQEKRFGDIPRER